MDEQQNNNTEPIEITKARSRVTTNTPAFQANTPGFFRRLLAFSKDFGAFHFGHIFETDFDLVDMLL